MIEQIHIAPPFFGLPAHLTKLQRERILKTRDRLLKTLLADIAKSGTLIRVPEKGHRLSDLFNRDANIIQRDIAYGHAKRRLDTDTKNTSGLYLIFNERNVPCAIHPPLTLVLRHLGDIPALTISNGLNKIMLPIKPQNPRSPQTLHWALASYQRGVADRNARIKRSFREAQDNLMRHAMYHPGVGLMRKSAHTEGVILGPALARRLFYITALTYPDNDNPFPKMILAK